MRSPIFVCRLHLRPLLIALSLVASAASAAAQTSDEFFDDNVLHDVHLRVHSSDWSKLKADFLENTYYPADLEWRGVVVRDVGIRSRGLASRNEFKPGLRVDMNRYTTGQRFLGMRSVLLDNVYRDVSLIRERVSMKLFARFGLPVPREAHARLFVNGQYTGVYALTEELGEDFVRRAMKKPDTDEPGRGTLFEYHWVDEWRFNYLGPALEAYMPKFEPRTHENDAISTLYQPIEELVRTVNEVPIERFLEAIDPLLDIRQFIRYLAVEMFLVEYDGLAGFKGLANFYFYRYEDSPRSIFIPWDKDQTFFVANRDIHHGLVDNVLIRRALDVPELRTLYYETLIESARMAAEREAEGGDPWLQRAIVHASDQIRGAVLSDPNRWFGTADFDLEIERMIEFAQTRPAFVLCMAEPQLGRAEPRECSAPDRPAPR
jgi:spore coat protein CotH